MSNAVWEPPAVLAARLYPSEGTDPGAHLYGAVRVAVALRDEQVAERVRPICARLVCSALLPVLVAEACTTEARCPACLLGALLSALAPR